MGGESGRWHSPRTRINQIKYWNIIYSMSTAKDESKR